VFENNSIIDYTVAVLLAIAGGLARVLNAKDRRKYKGARVLGELFTSGFVGGIVLLVADASGLSGSWVGAICGMSGFIGAQVLELIGKPVMKRVGVDLDEADKKDSEKK